MVRHTSTVVAVSSQADTQLSPMGVAWSTNALVAWSASIRSQDASPSHGPIVLRCPGNGRRRPWERLIKLQRDLMQDVGPEVLLHVRAVPVAHTVSNRFEPPFPYYRNCHKRILGHCACKRNKGSKGCWGGSGRETFGTVTKGARPGETTPQTQKKVKWRGRAFRCS
jgi:hypothetical protein